MLNTLLFIGFVCCKFLVIVLPMLLSVAFLTLAERKVMGFAHRRIGPNVVGIFGLLQAIFDGVKLLLKETILPEMSNKFLFLLAPMFTFLLSTVGWVVIPFNEVSVICDITLGILYLFAISTLGVYAVLLAGWSSNSRYALLGGLRSAAQMVSYEVAFGIIVLHVIVCVGSLNLINIIVFQYNIWFVLPLFHMFILFFVSTLAETNRAPFDLAEAETELVSGYNIEYSAMAFALFFMGEYGNIILMSVMSVIFFLGGWVLLPFCNVVMFLAYLPEFFVFSIKLIIVLFFFIWVRVSYPRYRYDQLMRLGWKVFLPLTLGSLGFVAGVLLTFNFLPYFF